MRTLPTPAEMDSLERKIRIAKKAYYLGEPIMTDAEYDEVEARLRRCRPDSPVLRGIGILDTECYKKKVQHAYIMGSLDKFTHGKPKALEGLRKALFMKWERVNITPKMDGMTLDLHYYNSNLKTASTRGDGWVGEDVTHNALTIASIPKHLKHCTQENVYVRGECMVTRSDLAYMNANGYDFLNCRNAAAGSIRLDSSEECAKRRLIFVGVEVIDSYGVATAQEKGLGWLERNGFKTPPLHQLEELEPRFLARDFWSKNCPDWDLDGAVCRFESSFTVAAMGYGSNGCPKFAFAWKWEEEQVETKMNDIEWNLSRLGRIKPTGILKPVKVAGCTVSRCTLDNAMSVVENQLSPGCRVLIKRAGEVIPNFVKNLEPSTDNLFPMPMSCPKCGKPAYWDSRELMCSNEQCTMVGRLLNFAQTMGWKGIGEAKIIELFDAGAISVYKHFYERGYSMDVPVTLATFLQALGIRHLGKSTAEKLADHFENNPDNFRILCLQHNGIYLECIRALGANYVTTARIAKYLMWECKVIAEVMEKVTWKKEPAKVSSVFADLTFAITGTLPEPRSKVEELIKQNGGKVGSLKLGNRFILLKGLGKDDSAKANKAKANGNRVIDWSQFNTMLKG